MQNELHSIYNDKAPLPTRDIHFRQALFKGVDNGYCSTGCYRWCVCELRTCLDKACKVKAVSMDSEKTATDICEVRPEVT